MQSNPSVQIINAPTCYPALVFMTGLVDYNGLEVDGTGTLFLTELCTGVDKKNLLYKYLFAPTLGEFREIDFVVNENKLRLKSAFSSDLSGVNVWCPDYRYSYKEVSIYTDKDGVTVSTVGTTLRAIKPNVAINYKSEDRLNPIYIEPNSNDVQVTTLL